MPETTQQPLPKLIERDREKFDAVLDQIESEDYSTPTATEGHIDALATLVKKYFFKGDQKFWGRTPSLSEAISYLYQKYEIDNDLKQALSELMEAIESFDEETDDAYHCEYEDWGYNDESDSEAELKRTVSNFTECFGAFLDRAK